MYRIQSYITSWITSYLEKYVTNLDPNFINLSVVNGKLTLFNVHLNTHVLKQELSLPIDIFKAEASKLEVNIAYSSIYNGEPIVIFLDNVTLKLKCSDSIKPSFLNEKIHDDNENKTNFFLEQILNCYQNLVSNYNASNLTSRSALSYIPQKNASTESINTNSWFGRMFSNVKYCLNNVLIEYVEEETRLNIAPYKLIYSFRIKYLEYGLAKLFPFLNNAHKTSNLHVPIAIPKMSLGKSYFDSEFGNIYADAFYYHKFFNDTSYSYVTDNNNDHRFDHNAVNKVILLHDLSFFIDYNALSIDAVLKSQINQTILEGLNFTIFLTYRDPTDSTPINCSSCLQTYISCPEFYIRLNYVQLPFMYRMVELLIAIIKGDSTDSVIENTDSNENRKTSGTYHVVADDLFKPKISLPNSPSDWKNLAHKLFLEEENKLQTGEKIHSDAKEELDIGLTLPDVAEIKEKFANEVWFLPKSTTNKRDHTFLVTVERLKIDIDMPEKLVGLSSYCCPSYNFEWSQVCCKLLYIKKDNEGKHCLAKPQNSDIQSQSGLRFQMDSLDFSVIYRFGSMEYSLIEKSLTEDNENDNSRLGFQNFLVNQMLEFCKTVNVFTTQHPSFFRVTYESIDANNTICDESCNYIFAFTQPIKMHVCQEFVNLIEMCNDITEYQYKIIHPSSNKTIAKNCELQINFPPYKTPFCLSTTKCKDLTYTDYTEITENGIGPKIKNNRIIKFMIEKGEIIVQMRGGPLIPLCTQNNCFAFESIVTLASSRSYTLNLVVDTFTWNFNWSWTAMLNLEGCFWKNIRNTITCVNQNMPMPCVSTLCQKGWHITCRNIAFSYVPITETTINEAGLTQMQTAVQMLSYKESKSYLRFFTWQQNGRIQVPPLKYMIEWNDQNYHISFETGCIQMIYLNTLVASLNGTLVTENKLCQIKPCKAKTEHGKSIGFDFYYGMDFHNQKTFTLDMGSISLQLDANKLLPILSKPFANQNNKRLGMASTESWMTKFQHINFKFICDVFDVELRAQHFNNNQSGQAPSLKLKFQNIQFMTQKDSSTIIHNIPNSYNTLDFNVKCSMYWLTQDSTHYFIRLCNFQAKMIFFEQSVLIDILAQTKPISIITNPQMITTIYTIANQYKPIYHNLCNLYGSDHCNERNTRLGKALHFKGAFKSISITMYFPKMSYLKANEPIDIIITQAIFQNVIGFYKTQPYETYPQNGCEEKVKIAGLTLEDLVICSGDIYHQIDDLSNECTKPILDMTLDSDYGINIRSMRNISMDINLQHILQHCACIMEEWKKLFKLEFGTLKNNLIGHETKHSYHINDVSIKKGISFNLSFEGSSINLMSGPIFSSKLFTHINETLSHKTTKYSMKGMKCHYTLACDMDCNKISFIHIPNDIMIVTDQSDLTFTYKITIEEMTNTPLPTISIDLSLAFFNFLYGIYTDDWLKIIILWDYLKFQAETMAITDKKELLSVPFFAWVKQQNNRALDKISSMCRNVNIHIHHISLSLDLDNYDIFDNFVNDTRKTPKYNLDIFNSDFTIQFNGLITNDLSHSCVVSHAKYQCQHFTLTQNFGNGIDEEFKTSLIQCLNENKEKCQSCIDVEYESENKLRPVIQINVNCPVESHICLTEESILNYINICENLKFALHKPYCNYNINPQAQWAHACMINVNAPFLTVYFIFSNDSKLKLELHQLSLKRGIESGISIFQPMMETVIKANFIQLLVSYPQVLPNQELPFLKASSLKITLNVTNKIGCPLINCLRKTDCVAKNFNNITTNDELYGCQLFSYIPSMVLKQKVKYNDSNVLHNNIYHHFEKAKTNLSIKCNFINIHGSQIHAKLFKNLLDSYLNIKKMVKSNGAKLLFHKNIPKQPVMDYEYPCESYVFTDDLKNNLSNFTFDAENVQKSTIIPDPQHVSFATNLSKIEIQFGDFYVHECSMCWSYPEPRNMDKIILNPPPYCREYVEPQNIPLSQTESSLLTSSLIESNFEKIISCKHTKDPFVLCKLEYGTLPYNINNHQNRQSSIFFKTLSELDISRTVTFLDCADQNYSVNIYKKPNKDNNTSNPYSDVWKFTIFIIHSPLTIINEPLLITTLSPISLAGCLCVDSIFNPVIYNDILQYNPNNNKFIQKLKYDLTISQLQFNLFDVLPLKIYQQTPSIDDYETFGVPVTILALQLNAYELILSKKLMDQNSSIKSSLINAFGYCYDLNQIKFPFFHGKNLDLSLETNFTNASFESDFVRLIVTPELYRTISHYSNDWKLFDESLSPKSISYFPCSIILKNATPLTLIIGQDMNVFDHFNFIDTTSGVEIQKLPIINNREMNSLELRPSQSLAIDWRFRCQFNKICRGEVIYNLVCAFPNNPQKWYPFSITKTIASNQANTKSIAINNTSLRALCTHEKNSNKMLVQIVSNLAVINETNIPIRIGIKHDCKTANVDFYEAVTNEIVFIPISLIQLKDLNAKTVCQFYSKDVLVAEISIRDCQKHELRIPDNNEPNKSKKYCYVYMVGCRHDIMQHEPCTLIKILPALRITFPYLSLLISDKDKLYTLEARIQKSENLSFYNTEAITIDNRHNNTIYKEKSPIRKDENPGCSQSSNCNSIFDFYSFSHNSFAETVNGDDPNTSYVELSLRDVIANKIMLNFCVPNHLMQDLFNNMTDNDIVNFTQKDYEEFVSAHMLKKHRDIVSNEVNLNLISGTIENYPIYPGLLVVHNKDPTLANNDKIGSINPSSSLTLKLNVPLISFSPTLSLMDKCLNISFNALIINDTNLIFHVMSAYSDVLQTIPPYRSCILDYPKTSDLKDDTSIAYYKFGIDYNGTRCFSKPIAISLVTENENAYFTTSDDQIDYFSRSDCRNVLPLNGHCAVEIELDTKRICLLTLCSTDNVTDTYVNGPRLITIKAMYNLDPHCTYLSHTAKEKTMDLNFTLDRIHFDPKSLNWMEKLVMEMGRLGSKFDISPNIIHAPSLNAQIIPFCLVNAAKQSSPFIESYMLSNNSVIRSFICLTISKPNFPYTSSDTHINVIFPDPLEHSNTCNKFAAAGDSTLYIYPITLCSLSTKINPIKNLYNLCVKYCEPSNNYLLTLEPINESPTLVIINSWTPIYKGQDKNLITNDLILLLSNDKNFQPVEMFNHYLPPAFEREDTFIYLMDGFLHFIHLSCDNDIGLNAELWYPYFSQIHMWICLRTKNPASLKWIYAGCLNSNVEKRSKRTYAIIEHDMEIIHLQRPNHYSITIDNYGQTMITQTFETKNAIPHNRSYTLNILELELVLGSLNFATKTNDVVSNTAKTILVIDQILVLKGKQLHMALDSIYYYDKDIFFNQHEAQTNSDALNMVNHDFKCSLNNFCMFNGICLAKLQPNILLSHTKNHSDVNYNNNNNDNSIKFTHEHSKNGGLDFGYNEFDTICFIRPMMNVDDNVKSSIIKHNRPLVYFNAKIKVYQHGNHLDKSTLSPKFICCKNMQFVIDKDNYIQLSLEDKFWLTFINHYMTLYQTPFNHTSKNKINNNTKNLYHFGDFMMYPINVGITIHFHYGNIFLSSTINSPLKLSPIVLDEWTTYMYFTSFLTVWPTVVVKKCIAVYQNDMLRNAAWILGSLGMFGSPAIVVSSLKECITSIFYTDSNINNSSLQKSLVSKDDIDCNVSKFSASKKHGDVYSQTIYDDLNLNISHFNSTSHTLDLPKKIVKTLTTSILFSLFNFCKNLNRNLDALTFDSVHTQYMKERRTSQWKNLKTNSSTDCSSERNASPISAAKRNIMTGFSDMGFGFIAGIASLIGVPLRECQQTMEDLAREAQTQQNIVPYKANPNALVNGLYSSPRIAKSLIMGLSKGMVGALLKPISGITQFLEFSTQGILNMIDTNKQHVNTSELTAESLLFQINVEESFYQYMLHAWHMRNKLKKFWVDHLILPVGKNIAPTSQLTFVPPSYNVHEENAYFLAFNILRDSMNGHHEKLYIFKFPEPGTLMPYRIYNIFELSLMRKITPLKDGNLVCHFTLSAFDENEYKKECSIDNNLEENGNISIQSLLATLDEKYFSVRNELHFFNLSQREFYAIKHFFDSLRYLIYTETHYSNISNE